MQSPIIISLASIIPGLELWLIGKRPHAIITAMLVFGSVFVCLFSPWDMLTWLSFSFAVFLWFMQANYAAFEARLAKVFKPGNKEGSAFVLPPPGLNRSEKEVFKTKELVRQQLGVEEQILDAIPALHMSAFGSYQFYYLGLLPNKLGIIHTDFMGQPAAIQQIDFSSIKNLTIEHGLLVDTLTLLIDPKKRLQLKVERGLRVHADNFVKVALSRPTHQRVTHTVSRPYNNG